MLPEETGPGLPVHLEVESHHVAVVSDSGDLGAWPLETVAVRRIGGDRFELTVAGEELNFVADDAMAFNYSGLPVLDRNRASNRTGFRAFLDRFWSDPGVSTFEAGGPSAPPPPAPGEEPPNGLSFDEVPEEAPPRQAGTSDDGTPSFTHPADGPSRVAKDPIEEATELFWPVETDPKTLAETTPARDILGPSEAFPDDDPPSPVSGLPASSSPVLEPPPQHYGCPARTTEGQWCQSPILAPSGYCYSHDPDRSDKSKPDSLEEERQRLREKGLARLGRVYRRLDKAVGQVERGELEPEIAMAMAQLARTMCAILEMDETRDS